MSGPTALVTSAVSTGFLAVFEAATGISIPLSVWGFVGCLWAFWYLPEMPMKKRLMSVAIAALLAGVAARPLSMIVIAAASGMFSWWPAEVDAQLVGVPIALILGMLCHTVIGKKLIAIANRAADGVAK